eukprot:710355-Amphidinium_carterae.1
MAGGCNTIVLPSVTRVTVAASSATIAGARLPRGRPVANAGTARSRYQNGRTVREDRHLNLKRHNARQNMPPHGDKTATGTLPGHPGPTANVRGGR